MCHFVTAVLPAGAAIDVVEAVALRYGRRLRPLSSPGIQAQLGADERYFLLDSGQCDCGTPLGAHAPRRARRAPDIAAQADRLRRKGWSEAKIARSLARARGQRDAIATPAATDELATITRWTALIHDILHAGQTPSLGLLLHFYDGALDAPFRLLERKVAMRSGLDDAMLARMNEDVLYLFQR